MIRFSCPKCGTEYEVGDEFAGVHALCEECQTKMLVPTGATTDKVVAQFVNQQDMRYECLEPSIDSSSEKMIINFEELEDNVSSGMIASTNTSVEVKMSPRQRRLQADMKMLLEHFSNFPFIQVKSYLGDPPEKYVIAYHVKGIERIDGERIVYRDYHEVEIKLSGTYPRTPPLCRVLTPIFHPNIEPAVICIGDHWTAAERLCDLVVRIGEMIAYQAHNVKSPLDGEAAMWTDLHLEMLPIDSSDLTPPNL